ncbi:zinc finger protein 2 homolog [Bradysia coprophila]|uniref:zinc finger protein 2 homolog n=1 Tax=Bradysia coprophila TaxID=38358 RepID=UPI00187DB991|nr:zinc finger protein 2 homolog [Bradysia coprophila]
MSIFSTICRSCLGINLDVINLFSPFGMLDNNDNLTFSDCFTIITNIKVEINDNMPQTICKRCMHELKIAFNFRKKCEVSDITLRSKCLKKEEDASVGKYDDIDADGDMLIEALDEVQFDENDVVLEDAGQGTIEIVIQQDPADLQHTQLRRSSRRRKSVNEWNKSTEHLEEYILTQEEHIECVKDEGQVEIVELSDNEFAVENDDIKDEYGHEPDGLDEPSNEEFEIHDKSIIEENEFECYECQLTSNDEIALEKHIKTVHNQKIYHLCNVCGKTFAQESSLKNHMATHHSSDKAFKCDKCDKSYTSKNGLQSHMFTHMDEKPERKFLCSECGKGFTTNQRLRIHTFTHTGERNFSCDQCDKSFATEFRLRSHRRIHTGERPYSCDMCNQTFAQGNALKCHKRTHTGEKPYACKYCDKSFSQNTILKTHMTLHTGKTVKCPDCDKKFSRASYLILHKREHTGEKPYSCDRCPNRYKQKSHLDRHMDTHLGVKYPCEVCQKEYSKQWSLKMHMFTHSAEKPFQCTDCTLSFVRKDKFKAHIKAYHPHRSLNDVFKKVEVVVPEEDSRPAKDDSKKDEVAFYATVIVPTSESM